jgi:hypothetical protein
MAIGRNVGALRTLDHMTTTTLDTTPVLRSPLVRWLAAMLEQARVRHADHPDFADQIAAYPATRSAAMVVLPLAQR